MDPRTVIILMLMAICGVANAADKKKPVETPSQPVSAPVPVMKPLKDIKVEASGLTTHISLGEMSAEFPVGKSTITWTVTGPDGTVSSATQTVIVTDTVAPVVTVPADITLEATAPQTPVKLGSATAIDVVDGKLTPAPDQTGPFGVGVHKVAWSAIDAAGNTGKAIQTITVTDTTAPRLAKPANVTAEATNVETLVGLVVPHVSDVADARVKLTSDAPAKFPIGSTLVTWTATDASGNVATTTQTVTVADTTPPIITPPPDLLVEATGPTTAVSLGTAFTSDIVDGVLTAKPDPAGPFAPGTYTIVWSATDAAGNTGTATQPLRVIDTTPPTITVPPDIVVEATGPKTAVTTQKVTAVDLVDGNVKVTSDAPKVFPIGATVVTWKATDAAGNSSTATRTVTVRDTTPPDITAPPNVTVEATGVQTEVKLGKATATDIVDGELTPIPDQSGPFARGIHTVVWSVKDAAGNSSSATQTVTVTDTSAPIVTPPPDIVVEATGRMTSVELGKATAQDVDGGQPDLKPDNTGPFPLGVHTVTWSVSDASRNIGTATQTVTVKDTTPPSFTVPADISVEATGPTTPVKLDPITAHDLVDGELKVKPDRTGPFEPGHYIITWSVTDAAGNTNTATQVVIVADKTAPELKLPENISVEATGPLTAVTLGSATATDPVDGELMAKPDKTGPFAPGRHTITWSVTDSAKNTATATQTVVITDTTPPAIDVPDDIVIEATGEKTAVALGSATANDLVDGVVKLVNDAPAEYPVDTTVVTWSAMDAAGNRATAQQFVTVEDNTPPKVTAPPDVTITAPGSVGALGVATAIDIVDGQLTPEPSEKGPFKPGDYKVVWTATDKAGNKATAEQKVTVIKAPVAPEPVPATKSSVEMPPAGAPEPSAPVKGEKSPPFPTN